MKTNNIMKSKNNEHFIIEFPPEYGGKGGLSFEEESSKLGAYSDVL